MTDNSKKPKTPGEHSFLEQGAAGPIEGILTIPEQMKPDCLAILGHPHSLQGGSMTNKVVTTLARALKEEGIPSIRFNFRGVGRTAGQYDDGIGESEDMLYLAKIWQERLSTPKLFFAGFSFGSYVTYRAAAQMPCELLISIAPPVHHYDYKEFSIKAPWHIFQGDEDEVSPLSLVLEFANSFTPPLPVTRFPETSHFFHGKLLELKAAVRACLQAI